MTDSHCCKAETNTILLTIILQLKIEKKFKKTVSNAGDKGLIPGQGTKIPYGTWPV